MPMPVSITSTFTMPSSPGGMQRTRTDPSSVNLSALLTRFVST